MASTRASKLISLTDYLTGATFVLSANKIIYFQLVGSNDSLVCYTNQKGRTSLRRFTETVSQIWTATASDTVSKHRRSPFLTELFATSTTIEFILQMQEQHQHSSLTMKVKQVQWFMNVLYQPQRISMLLMTIRLTSRLNLLHKNHQELVTSTIF